ncbi:probable disease resistance protein At5g63020 [Prosopis cineraria]|uniref:probable disease resistance protein At5g63020 n=1 Tax=Prosopis cineraria TaxID=364024 RepID=UPI0024101F21|nr:probable disease resistance protein At5g63020 [Prosopis cineraria]
MSSYKQGKNVVKILRNAQELQDEGEKLFGKDIKITQKHRMRPIELPLEETVGLDLMFEKVWKSIDDKNVGVIGLHGMGGVGKTTLLKKINNKFGKESQIFMLCGWWYLKDVCVKMHSERKFEVKILTEKEALELFHMKVGVETLNSNPSIPRLVMEMARECKELPLALAVVGSAMAGVESVEAWEHSKNNLRSSSYTASGLETKVFSILKFGYDQLPDETHKNCFLYCALYPEDYEIMVYDFIDKWIREGFLYTDSPRNVREMCGYGGSIIEKLKLSCLLESVEDEIFLECTIKMHDVIHDMALWIACDQDGSKMKVMVQEDAWALSQANAEKGEMVERILIMKDIGSQIPIMAWRNLMTLCLNVEYNHGAITGLQNIQHSSRLKVLELRGVPNVPAEIGGLIHLEYLSLQVVELQKVS